MSVYVNNYGQLVPDDYLAHHGILGMHWGIRRFQPYPKGYTGDGKFTGKRSNKLEAWRNKEILNVNKRYQTRIEDTKAELARKSKLYNSEENINKVYNTLESYKQEKELMDLEYSLSKLPMERDTELKRVSSMTIRDIREEKIEIAKDKLFGKKTIFRIDSKANVRLNKAYDALLNLEKDMFNKLEEADDDNERFRNRVKELYKTDPRVMETIVDDMGRSASWDLDKKIINATNDPELKSIAKKYNGTSPHGSILKDHYKEKANIFGSFAKRDSTASDAYSKNNKIRSGRIRNMLNELPEASRKRFASEAEKSSDRTKADVVRLFNMGKSALDISKEITSINSPWTVYSILEQEDALDK